MVNIKRPIISFSFHVEDEIQAYACVGIILFGYKCGQFWKQIWCWKGENCSCSNRKNKIYLFNIGFSPKLSTFLPLPFHRKKVMTKYNGGGCSENHKSSCLFSQPHFTFCLCKFMCSPLRFTILSYFHAWGTTLLHFSD